MRQFLRLASLRLALVLAVCLGLSGCGYHFTGTGTSDGTEQASRLAPELRQMAVLRVDNPSTEAWIEPRLRSLIRDEFNRRRLVTWTDKAKATSLLTIVIKKFTRSTTISGQSDQTVKLSVGGHPRDRHAGATHGGPFDRELLGARHGFFARPGTPGPSFPHLPGRGTLAPPGGQAGGRARRGRGKHSGAHGLLGLR